MEEEYGDARSSYWLARGRVLDYTADADTLRARLELLTVAAQEPRSDSAYGSVVTARVRSDTLVLKMVPDSLRRTWQTCGLLSNGFSLGGYGRPDGHLQHCVGDAIASGDVHEAERLVGEASRAVGRLVKS